MVSGIVTLTGVYWYWSVSLVGWLARLLERYLYWMVRGRVYTPSVASEVIFAEKLAVVVPGLWMSPRFCGLVVMLIGAPPEESPTVTSFAVVGRSTGVNVPWLVNTTAFVPLFWMTTVIVASCPGENSLTPERYADISGAPPRYLSAPSAGVMQKTAVRIRRASV